MIDLNSSDIMDAQEASKIWQATEGMEAIIGVKDPRKNK